MDKLVGLILLLLVLAFGFKWAMMLILILLLPLCTVVALGVWLFGLLRGK